MPERLELTKTNDGYIVSCDERYEDRLGAEEALWCVVRFLTGTSLPAYLRTQSEHDAWDARYNPKPLEAWQKQLPEAGNA